MALKDAPRCQAHNQRGEPCGNPAIKGAAVCRIHGGSAPQVREAAKRRMLELLDPAMARLAEALQLPADTPADWQTVMRAVKEVLDRAGIDTPKQIEVITLDQIEQEIMRLEAELAEEAAIGDVDPGT